MDCHHPHNYEHGPEELLKEAGLKVTLPRKEILDLLLKKHGPFTAGEILNLLPADCCDQATVFRILKQFKDKELITDLFFDGERVHYEYNRPGHHHHHIICTHCGKKETLEVCNLRPLVQEAKDKGFSVSQHRIELFGLCPNCLDSLQ